MRAYTDSASEDQGQGQDQGQEQECHVCLIKIEEKDKVQLACGDIFHKVCLSSTYETKIKERNLDLRCPDCAYELDYKIVGQIVSKQMLELYDKTLIINSLIIDDQIFFCPTVNCPGTFQIIPTDFRYFQCVICEKDYCLICHQAYHGKSDCVLSGSEQAQGCLKCPKCETICAKDKGCNIVQCTICQFQFCFDCTGTNCRHHQCLSK